jgi:hypothetical protein
MVNHLFVRSVQAFTDGWPAAEVRRDKNHLRRSQKGVYAPPRRKSHVPSAPEVEQRRNASFLVEPVDSGPVL